MVAVDGDGQVAKSQAVEGGCGRDYSRKQKSEWRGDQEPPITTGELGQFCGGRATIRRRARLEKALDKPLDGGTGQGRASRAVFFSRLS